MPGFALDSSAGYLGGFGLAVNARCVARALRISGSPWAQALSIMTAPFLAFAHELAIVCLSKVRHQLWRPAW